MFPCAVFTSVLSMDTIQVAMPERRECTPNRCPSAILIPAARAAGRKWSVINIPAHIGIDPLNLYERKNPVIVPRVLRAHEEFGSDLRAALKKPLPQAKKALKRVPSIGDPAAEKILLFVRSCPVFSLDSNGLRVLCRVGFAEEQKNYLATCRLVQDAIRDQLPRDYDSLIRAHQLLRQHGQELCKRYKPRLPRISRERCVQLWPEGLICGLTRGARGTGEGNEWNTRLACCWRGVESKRRFRCTMYRN